jgi:hypothetical protein
MEKRNNGGEGGLSYEAITAITIGVAGFAMLMVVACAVNMRRKKGLEGKTDATDLDPEQQIYMRENRNRNRDTLTGTKRFTMAAAANPPSRQPSSYMARSGMSDYGYDGTYTPSYESKPASRRQSAYADHSPEGGYHQSCRRRVLCTPSASCATVAHGFCGGRIYRKACRAYHRPRS